MVENNVDATLTAPVEAQTAPQVSAESQPAGLTQAEINDLVGAAKQKGYQKALRDTAQFSGHSNVQQQSPSGDNGTSSSINEADLQNVVKNTMAEMLEKQRQEQLQQQQLAQAEQIVKELTPKLEDARGRYEDYDMVINSATSGFQNNPHILAYANGVDNAGDVLYDISKNPEKLIALAQMPEDMARSRILALSNSIKQNNQAPKQTSAPLNHISSSSKSPDSEPEYSVAYFQNKYARDI